MAVGGVGMDFTFPVPYTTPKYLPVTQPIPKGNEKSNPIPFSDGFWYPLPIPIAAVDTFFLIGKRSIFHTWAQCCNVLSIKEMMAIDGYGDGEE
jgi:hypothetical protein